MIARKVDSLMPVAMSARETEAHLNDEALVRACQRGDAAAWEALVTRYQRLVYSIPRRAGLSEELAADVFQQVFAMLVEHVDRIEQPERIGAWLATTARRESWRVSRRQRETRTSRSSLDTAEIADELDTVPDDLPLPDDVLLRIEEQTTVRTAVNELAEPCRTLVDLLFYQPDAPPYERIAATLGIPVGSVGPTRARCLQKLRHALSKIGF